MSSAKWRPFFLGFNGLTLSWVLMPWLLSSPGHHQRWYWLCVINGLSPVKRGFHCFALWLVSLLRTKEKAIYILMFPKYIESVRSGFNKRCRREVGRSATHWFICYCWGCLLHYDVIKWKHFPRNWSFARGIHRSPVNSPHKGQWRGALMFSMICAWINGWVNNHEAGDLRRHRARYDVNVIHGDAVTSMHVEINSQCQCGTWITAKPLIYKIP